MFDVHFKLRYCRKNKQPDYSLPATIQFVVNIDGVYSSARSTGMSVMGNKWSGSHQKITGSSDEVQAQNRRLSNIKADLDKLHQELFLFSEYVLPQHVVDVYCGKKQKRITVLKAFENMLEELKNPTQPRAKVLKKKTLDKYDKCLEYLTDFLTQQKLLKIEIIQFTHPAAEKFRKFLYNKDFGTDHVSRYISYLKKSFQRAKKEGDTLVNHISDVPCPRIKPKKARPLNLEQLEQLVEYRASDAVMQQAADIIVFLAFTGLDHCDYVNFDPMQDIIVVKGAKVITMQRLKMFRGGSIPDEIAFPLLPQAESILNKYDGCLPYMKYHTVLKNMKHIIRNLGVKENMALKNLRETFGSYLLNKGINLVYIRDSMGHASVKQTEETYTIVFPETLVDAYREAGLI